jgi:hypothetical protein
MMSRVAYAWGSTSYKVAAQVVGEELESIEEQAGEVTPRAIVDRASSPNNVLHPFFEWNNDRAADKWRLEQARHLVQSVIVKEIDGAEPKEPVRAFVSISREAGRSYVGIATAMSDDEKRAAVLQQAKKELEDWRQRYRSLTEFAKLFDAIDQLNVAGERLQLPQEAVSARLG